MRLRSAGFDVFRYGTVQLEEQPAQVAGDVITSGSARLRGRPDQDLVDVDVRRL